jgi:hypothetical protein
LTDEFGNEIEIYKIEILSGELTIYDLGVEDNDLYIANGILTHNITNKKSILIGLLYYNNR